MDKYYFTSAQLRRLLSDYTDFYVTYRYAGKPSADAMSLAASDVLEGLKADQELAVLDGEPLMLQLPDPYARIATALSEQNPQLYRDLLRALKGQTNVEPRRAS